MSITLSFVGEMMTIYCGTPVLIGGLSGEFVNIIVFLSHSYISIKFVCVLLNYHICYEYWSVIY